MLPKLLNYLQSPAWNSWVNHAGHPDGSALDLGWRVNDGNKNQPMYGMGEMKVLDVGYFNDSGNYIVMGAQYDDNWDVWASVQHMRDKSACNAGELIGRSTLIGYMGATGKAHGEHAHIRLTFVPHGTKFSWATFNASKRYKPLDYVYATSDMDVIDMKHIPGDWSYGQEASHVTQHGIFTATDPLGSNIRNRPSKTATRIGGLPTGEEFEYISYVDNEGIRWVYNDGKYIARRMLDGSQEFGDARFVDEPTKPSVNEYGQAVFEGSEIEFSYIYNRANNGKAGQPYFKNNKGRGYGKVTKVFANSEAPYQVELNGEVIGFVAPVNTY